MELSIDKGKTVREIQQQFVAYYPGLKIEFYSEGVAYGVKNASPLSAETKIGEIPNCKKEGVLNIAGVQKVSDFEKHFKDEFGIAVQVFRKSNQLWLMTGATDHWTLDEQNKEALQGDDGSPITDSATEFDSFREQE